MKKILLAILILILLAIGGFATFVLSDDIPRMTKEELKAMLGNPDIVILDFRFASDYWGSDLKIKGAVRPYYGHSQIFPSDYPGKTLVLYCASPDERVSASGAQHLKGRGFTKVYVLKGGWEEWLKANYPTEKK